MSDESKQNSDTPGKEPAGKKGDGFNLKKLARLMRLMEEHGLTELSLSSEAQDWKLVRGGHAAAPVVAAAPQMVAAPAVAPAAVPVAAAPPAAGGGAASEPAADDNAVYITAPTVGTFYRAPSPDADPFVSVGDAVKADTVVCTIEAMKVYNPIPAGLSGKVAEVLIEDGQAVEYGEKLFRIESN